MKSKTYTLGAGDLSVVLRDDGGLLLDAVNDAKTGSAFLSESRPLFSLTAERLADDETFTVSSADGWTVNCTETDGSRLFILSGCEKLPGVTVTLTANLGCGRIGFETVLSSVNEEITLTVCDWPNLCFDAGESAFLFQPYGSGEVWSSVARESFSQTENYPSYGASMQYLAFWDESKKRGVYYGLHDPAPASKLIHVSRAEGENTVTLKISQPLEGISKGCNSQRLYGENVWQIFDGDWFDAAMLYREWAIENASWIPETDENGRKDVPQWFKENPHWWLSRMDHDNVGEETVRATKDLGCKSAAHFYNWHKIPYDNDYPHYFPPKDDMAENVAAMRRAGIRVMPYINGRLWDTKDRGNEDWQFSEKGYPNCTKDRHGKPFIETYNSRESDGKKVELSIMCPSTAVWQETVRDLVDRIFNELKMDAIYIDQIGAAKANPCADKNHPHPAGGGRWWIDSYRNLLTHAHLASDNVMITTECTSDPYMKQIGGYLSWLWIRDGQVPAFNAVYNEYVITFGISYGSITDADSDCMRIFFAQSLVYGVQMGWMRPDLYFRMSHKDFYRKLVKFRETYADYFYGGRMLRPPYLSDNAPRLVSDKCTQAINGHVDYPAVQGGLWQRMTTGRRLLILVNAAEVPADVDMSVSLPDGTYALNGDMDGSVVLKDGKASLTMPPLSMVYMFAD